MSNFVVGLGEVLWDVLPSGKKLGGAPANFAYHAAQFGANGMVVSAVGNDALGTEILDVFATQNRKHTTEVVPYPTGVVEVTLNTGGIPVYNIKENAAWDYIPFTDKLKEIAESTQAVCFGSLAQRSKVSRNTIYSFLDAMPVDSLKIFDINLRLHFYNEEIIAASLDKCNVLKLNDEELAVLEELFGLQPATRQEQCLEVLERFRLKLLILTCGAVDSYIITADETSHQQTPKVEVVDTVGAGDSFTGSFCASLLKGNSIKKAHELAVRVAAYVCTQKGATPIIPPEIGGNEFDF